jgi:NADPH2:quinone reductase
MIPIGLLMGSKSVMGVNMLNIGDQQPHVLRRCMMGVIELVKAQKIKPHVGASFRADQIAEAHELLESRKSVGKVVVYWDNN